MFSKQICDGKQYFVPISFRVVYETLSFLSLDKLLSPRLSAIINYCVTTN